MAWWHRKGKRRLPVLVTVERAVTPASKGVKLAVMDGEFYLDMPDGELVGPLFLGAVENKVRTVEQLRR